MKDAIADFLRHLEHERRYSEHTLRNYRGDLDSFLVFAETTHGKGVTVKQFDLHLVRRYVASLFGRNHAASIARKLSTLRSWGHFLVKNEQLKDNPAALVPMPKRPKTLPKFLSVDELFGIVDQ